MAKLTNLRKRFVSEYLVDLNATQAAIRAGYSKKTANNQIGKLLSDIGIQKAIGVAMARRSARTDITQDRVLNEIARVAFSRIKDYVSWGPNGVVLKSSDDLTEDQAAVVAEVSEMETKDGGSQKFKLHDKLKALELLGRHLGAFNDKLEIKHTLSISKLSDEDLDMRIKDKTKLLGP